MNHSNPDFGITNMINSLCICGYWFIPLGEMVDDPVCDRQKLNLFLADSSDSNELLNSSVHM